MEVVNEIKFKKSKLIIFFILIMYAFGGAGALYKYKVEKCSEDMFRIYFHSPKYKIDIDAAFQNSEQELERRNVTLLNTSGNRAWLKNIERDRYLREAREECS